MKKNYRIKSDAEGMINDLIALGCTVVATNDVISDIGFDPEIIPYSSVKQIVGKDLIEKLKP